MITECIILAGGLGTRLRSVVADVPKCMAVVAGKPFLHYVISNLQKQGVEKFIFSTGYKSELIEKYLEEISTTINYQLSIETEPLGTGGAIKLACSKVCDKDVIVVNGDTLFKADLKKLSGFHLKKNAECTLCLKPMENFDRYGAVEINKDGSIIYFNEKKYYTKGLINGGVYALNVINFLKNPFTDTFSFEKDYMEKMILQGKINHGLFGLKQDEYFIDIGVPEDYKRAQKEFGNLTI